MKMIFAIFDKVAGTYGVPMFVPNAQVMVRSLGDELKRDPTSVMAQHAEDFCLHEFGEWHEESGSFDLFDHHRLVVEVDVLVEAPAAPISQIREALAAHQVGMP